MFYSYQLQHTSEFSSSKVTVQKEKNVKDKIYWIINQVYTEREREQEHNKDLF